MARSNLTERILDKLSQFLFKAYNKLSHLLRSQEIFIKQELTVQFSYQVYLIN